MFRENPPVNPRIGRKRSGEPAPGGRKRPPTERPPVVGLFFFVFCGLGLTGGKKGVKLSFLPFWNFFPGVSMQECSYVSSLIIRK